MTFSPGAQRIAFVSMHTSPTAAPGAADAGGMNVVTLNAAKALAKRGHQVDLITRRDNPEQPALEYLAPGVRLLNVDAGPARPLAKSQQESVIEPFAQALHGLDGYDLVHSHHWFSGVAALGWARELGVPHVQSFHSVAAPAGAELSAGEQPESPGRPAGERLVARASDLVIAVSQFEAATIEQRYGTDPSRLAVVYPGVDLHTFHPLAPGERHWAWNETGGCYLLFASRLQPLKAPDLAIRTLAEIPTESRPQLVIAGEASQDFASYELELHTMVGELGLRDKVTFLGAQTRDELASMMRGSCLLINPSYSETFGLTLLEAQASGVPVVARRAGGMVEAVSDGVTGLLIDGDDARVWAQAVRRLMDDGDIRAQMGSAGEQFASRHTWNQVAADLELAYQRVFAAESDAAQAPEAPLEEDCSAAG